ncbi:hypothetical protein CHCC20335_2000 [Bacillus paralicheniformis]|nr:hypothetical protein CHCC20335_2000 [Bacillus paralicheniformis]
MQKDGRMPFIGHGYTSMPHSFKHGYGTAKEWFRRAKSAIGRHTGIIREKQKTIVFCFFS